jgi:hypothetical protein
VTCERDGAVPGCRYGIEMRRAIFILSSVACAAALLTGAAPARASATMEIGLQDDAVFIDQYYYGRGPGLDRAAELGVTSIRANMIWSRVLGRQATQRTRPSTPRYDFSRFDALVAEARARGMRVQLALTGTAPRWATRDRRVSNRGPSVREFGRFASAVARHFRGRVARYSIWNEPNWHTWLNPGRTAAAQYRSLYLASYKAIKRADRRAEVIFGELAPQARRAASYAPLRFMRDVLCIDSRGRKRRSCGILRADGVSLHPYDYRHAPTARRIPRDDVTVATVSRLTGQLARFRRAKALATPGGKQPPVHLTEFAYFATGPLKLSASRRARYIPQAFSIARRNRHVAQMLYYGLVQNPRVQWNTGLLKPDGSPEAPFTALRDWVARERQAGRLRPR